MSDPGRAWREAYERVLRWREIRAIKKEGA